MIRLILRSFGNIHITRLVFCQASFDELVGIILDFGFWILENCPIPHFKVDRPLVDLKATQYPQEIGARLTRPLKFYE